MEEQVNKDYVLQSQIGKRMTRIVFMGTSEFAAVVLEALASGYTLTAVYTRADKPAGRGKQMSESPVKTLARRLSVPVEQPRSLRTEAAQARLRELAPDLIVVAAYGLILPEAILTIPISAAINTHASLLPRWRGASPVAAAILAGDTETGITLMQMDAGVDTGPVIASRKITIARDDTTGKLSLRLSHLASSLLVETLPDWLSGKITPVPQVGEASLAGMILKEAGLIDWSRPAIQIERAVRAYNPWPSAFTYLVGTQSEASQGSRQMLKIWGADLSLEVAQALPGTVVKLENGIGVATGRGVLRLKEVQLAGRRAMPVEEFVPGQKGFVGSRLTN